MSRTLSGHDKNKKRQFIHRHYLDNPGLKEYGIMKIMNSRKFITDGRVSVNLDEDVLRANGVALVILFGSQVEGGAHPLSDVDVGVLFSDLSKLKNDPVDVYGSLHEEFSLKIGDNIDVVYLHEAPLSLQFRAVMDGIVLYTSKDSFFCDYKERITLLYLDFRFFEKIFDEAVT